MKKYNHPPSSAQADFGRTEVKKMKRYNHKLIEKKWQKFWEQNGFYVAKDFDQKKKFYTLVEFPYPSGDGLHVGHVRSYSALDVIARYHRMLGKNVLYPIGWDAFGLPTENYAIKNKIHPRVATDKNVKNFRKQLKALGLSFDWSREVDTTDPRYYKWTQWIFLQFYKAGMAYRDEIAINWCPKCKTGLANEEVVDGKHERCGTPVTKKLLKQWLLRITKYADRLIEDLEKVDFPERVKTSQINWIGRSEGAKIKFTLRFVPGQQDDKHSVEVFTTRPDTLFGVTFLVVSPELAQKWLSVGWQASADVKKYIDSALSKFELDRQDENKEKTGVDAGIKAVHPMTDEELPVWVADYVLGSYGTGAIMAVPAHDNRDFDFAKKYKLPIKQVIAPETGTKRGNETKASGGCSVVFDPKSQKYAVARWEKGWYGLFSGGLEPGESEEAAVLRELTEESGLFDFEKVERNVVAYPHYHNSAKNKNRFGSAACYLVILKSSKEHDTNKQPHEQFVLEWHTAEEILQNWSGYNQEKDIDHWIWFLKQAVGRAIELGYDKSSDAKLFKQDAYVGEGQTIDSDKYSGLPSQAAAKEITKDLEKLAKGEKTVSYKLRDWVFSRQHYWGEPIPLVFCEHCAERIKNRELSPPSASRRRGRGSKDEFSKGELENPGWIEVPEDQLPVELPKVKSYEPTDTGESPLASIKKFVETICPKCGGKARRETDTMPNWAGSNWYFLRYLDPENDKSFADRKKIDYWMPVDLYNGGMEHTTLHLLYSRFIYKFLYDQKLVPGPEPYAKRTSHGVILAPDGRKMSKSFGNVINPDDIVAEYGADTLRMYEMFLAPFDQMVPWDERGVVGVKRFLDRLWKYYSNSKVKIQKSEAQVKSQNLDAERLIHKLIKKITSDLHDMKFNTAVAAFMSTLNELENLQPTSYNLQAYLKLLAPFAPHIAEELWKMMGNKDSIHQESWPEYDEKMIVEDTLKIVVQVNGKVRDAVETSATASESDIESLALKSKKVQTHTAGKEIVKRIHVKGRLVNFVVK